MKFGQQTIWYTKYLSDTHLLFLKRLQMLNYDKLLLFIEQPYDWLLWLLMSLIVRLIDYVVKKKLLKRHKSPQRIETTLSIFHTRLAWKNVNKTRANFIQNNVKWCKSCNWWSPLSPLNINFAFDSGTHEVHDMNIFCDALKRIKR